MADVKVNWYPGKKKEVLEASMARVRSSQEDTLL